jgi:hypothetical protein
MVVSKNVTPLRATNLRFRLDSSAPKSLFPMTAITRDDGDPGDL